jgi:tripartite-type tricarboxylate transporter receptor subunit TctC
MKAVVRKTAKVPHRLASRSNERRLVTQHPRRRVLSLAAGAAAMSAAARMAWAQSYPSRPITIVVPFAAGGPTDVIARTLADNMRTAFGQPVIVENVSGAGGTIGVGRVARATPDGYTLSIGQNGSHVTNGAIYRLQYDLLNDFEPVALLSTTPLLIVAKTSMPASDLKGLIAWLKANPNKATQGNAGFGGISHVAGLLFQKETATHFQFVPYRGAGPAMLDLVAGHIDLMITTEGLPQIRLGNIKPYAVMAKTRFAAAPDIPTIDEAGLPGLYASIWNALWVPKRTPKDVISKLNGAVLDAMAHPAAIKRFADLGQEIFPPDQQTPEALRLFQKAEIEKWWPIIKAANIRGE